MTFLFVATGGSIGALCRYLISKAFILRDYTFPLATLIVNVFGSFILGIFSFLYTNEFISIYIWYSLGVGFCGAFTTFSTFSVEVINLFQNKHYWIAIIYIIASCSLTFLALLLGYIL